MDTSNHFFLDQQKAIFTNGRRKIEKETIPATLKPTPLHNPQANKIPTPANRGRNQERKSPTKHPAKKPKRTPQKPHNNKEETPQKTPSKKIGPSVHKPKGGRKQAKTPKQQKPQKL